MLPSKEDVHHAALIAEEAVLVRSFLKPLCCCIFLEHGIVFHQTGMLGRVPVEHELRVTKLPRIYLRVLNMVLMQEAIVDS